MMDGSGISLRVMRRAALPALAPIGVILLGLSAPAPAQVTLDLHALDALPAEAARPPQRHVYRRAERTPTRRTAKAREPMVAAAKPAAKSSPPQVVASLPTVPTTPPTAPPATVAAIPPLAAGPAPPSVPAATLPAPAPAPDRTLRVGFAAGQADLTAPDASALASLAHDTPRGDTTSFEVAAYAPATGGDASIARRLSLARALAVRGALVGAGVPAGSIYVRALGAPHPGQPGDADRAVVTVMGANGAPQKQASQR
ncbi:MAG: OmpA family protein [Acetobacteraceae bacterium]